MATTYRVIIRGLQEGFSKDQVNSNLARLFKTTVDKLPNVLGQQAFTVKKNLELAEAKKYQNLIQQQGCVCTVELEEAEELTLGDEHQENTNNDTAPTQLDDGNKSDDQKPSQVNILTVIIFAILFFGAVIGFRVVKNKLSEGRPTEQALTTTSPHENSATEKNSKVLLSAAKLRTQLFTKNKKEVIAILGSPDSTYAYNDRVSSFSYYEVLKNEHTGKREDLEVIFLWNSAFELRQGNGVSEKMY